MLNNVCIMGRLTRPPEVRVTASGISVCTFTIACNRPKHGEEQQTDFIDCVAWRSTADFVSKWFDKGDMIIVNGRLQTRTYEDKGGYKRKAVEVIVNTADFGGSKKNGTNTAIEIPPPEEVFGIDDNDLPF